MNIGRIAARSTAAGLVGVALCLPTWALAGDDDVTELRRELEALRAENRALAKRVEALEATKAGAAQNGRNKKPAAAPAPAPTTAQAGPVPKAARAPPPPQTANVGNPPAAAASTEQLEERVRELEIAKAGQEEATRAVIRNSLAGLGPQINEFVALGGSLETTVSRFRDFTSGVQDSVTLSTAELDLDIKANDWTTGSLIVGFNPGTDTLFPTTEGLNVPVDRLTVERGTVTVGDTQRFPLYVKAGRDTLSFGTSTGIARLDTLAIVNPLTIEAFETKNNFFGFGFGFPTPTPAPLTPPIVVPPVRPLVISPLVSSLARNLGYTPPPTPPKPPTPYTPPPTLPPFYGSLDFYNGDSLLAPNRKFTQSIDASVGARAEGHCGRSYDQLRASYLCPWSLDVHIDYNSSVFDSVFLNTGYQGFLNQIGLVPGVAISAKASLGPIALTGELNAATRQASFVDGAGAQVNIVPTAWQFAIAYQFDWNPWVEKIGEQGDFIAITYSGTSGFAGATQVINGQPTRVGFLPKTRLSVTAGEWVLDGVEFALEYTIDWDYPKKDGGTGNIANGVFAALTYNF